MNIALPKMLPCAGKTRHDTHKAAAKELKRNKGKRMNVYKCGDCGAYHIGHDSGGGASYQPRSSHPARLTSET